MPYTKRTWDNETITDPKLQNIEDGLAAIFPSVEIGRPSGAGNPFTPTGTPPIVAQLCAFEDYLSYAGYDSDGYFKFGDSLAWSTTNPGLPEGALFGSTGAGTPAAVLNHNIILPAATTTLKKIEGRMVMALRRSGGTGDVYIDSFDIILMRIKTYPSTSLTVLDTTNVAVNQATNGTSWKQITQNFSIDYGAGYSFSTGLDNQRIVIGIKTYGRVIDLAATCYHGLGVFPTEVAGGLTDNWVLPQRPTFGFYFE